MPRQALLTILPALLGFPLLTACQSVTIVDDVDWSLSFNPLPDDDLHGPYIQGTQIGFTVRSSERDEAMVGWRLISSNPEVLEISDQGVSAHPNEEGGIDASLHALARALSGGTVRLIVAHEDGSEIHSREVTVGKPDSIELLYHGPLLLEWPPEEALSTDPWILENGTGTFMVRYFTGDQELFGNGALQVSSADDTAATFNCRRTNWGKDRDWLSITPYRTGSVDFDLSVDGDVITTRTLVAVSASSIDNVSLLKEDDQDAHQGDELMVLAQAYSNTGVPIYGVEYSWDIEGYLLYGFGDLLIYEFGEDELDRTVNATFGTHSASTQIRSAGAVNVGSTNNLGCVAARAHGAAALACLLLGLALRRRRRRHRQEITSPSEPQDRV